MKEPKELIPIFFACDENYLKYLAVAIRSIDEHSSNEYLYSVRILSEGISAQDAEKIASMKLENTTVEFIDVRALVSDIRERLRESLRDYYSESIFYRIFIPGIFPELDRAVYLDCDIVLCDDIAKMYHTDIGNNILGAVADESVLLTPQFTSYVNEVIGVKETEYINSGVLLINCKQFRDNFIEKKILALIKQFNFKTVAPDQDYLNFLCRDRIYYFEAGWNKQPNRTRGFDHNSLHLVHYNHFEKPWRYNGVLYEELFWSMARKTPYFSALALGYENYSDEEKARDIAATVRLLESAESIKDSRCSFAHILPCKTNDPAAARSEEKHTVFFSVDEAKEKIRKATADSSRGVKRIINKATVKGEESLNKNLTPIYTKKNAKNTVLIF